VKVKHLILLAALVLAGCQSSRTERVGNFLITHKRPGSFKMTDGRAVRGVYDLAGYRYVCPLKPLAHPESQAIMAANRIPWRIQKLNGKEITLVGAILPLSVKKGEIHECLILANSGGGCPAPPVPKVNEWLYISNIGVPTRTFSVAGTGYHWMLTGKFRVGIETEDGYLTGLYRLEDVRFHNLREIDMTKMVRFGALRQRYSLFYIVDPMKEPRNPFEGTVTELDDHGQPVREVKLVGGIPVREKHFQHKTANAE